MIDINACLPTPENEKEREALINDILDRMNEIREKLKE